MPRRRKNPIAAPTEIPATAPLLNPEELPEFPELSPEPEEQSFPEHPEESASFDVISTMFSSASSFQEQAETLNTPRS